MKFPFQLSTNKQFDVLGFGTNAVDYLIQVPGYPQFNSKTELDNYVQAAGGEVASTMVGLQRLGLRTAYAGRFGDDREGEFGIASLVAEGVDVSQTARIADTKTQVGFIMIDSHSGERTVLWQRDKKHAYEASDAPVDYARGCRVLHITPHDTAACFVLATAARESGAIVSMDIDNVFDGVEELLPLVDICIASAEFPEKLLGIRDKKQALLEMRSRYGCPVIGLTVGESGSVILCEETFVESPAYEIPGGCVDTTGAGDAFRTGLLYGLLSDESVEESSRIGNAVAALKCRGLGARATLPTILEVKTWLKNN